MNGQKGRPRLPAGEKTKVVGISFTPESLENLDMMAQVESRSRSQIVRRLIVAAVAQEEEHVSK